MSDPAPASDIAALIERFDAAAREWGWQVGEEQETWDIEAEYSAAKQALFAARAAQQAEIERLRRKIEQAQAIIEALNGGLAARDETIRGLRDLLTEALDSRAPDYAHIAHPGWPDRVRAAIQDKPEGGE